SGRSPCQIPAERECRNRPVAHPIIPHAGYPELDPILTRARDSHKPSNFNNNPPPPLIPMGCHPVNIESPRRYHHWFQVCKGGAAEGSGGIPWARCPRAETPHFPMDRGGTP